MTIITSPGPELDDAEAWLDDLDVDTVQMRDSTQVRAIIAARAELETAEREVARARARLGEAVAGARAAGDSWAVIGMALETTRQAAQQRFGNRR